MNQGLPPRFLRWVYQAKVMNTLDRHSRPIDCRTALMSKDGVSSLLHTDAARHEHGRKRYAGQQQQLQADVAARCGDLAVAQHAALSRFKRPIPANELQRWH